MSSQKKLKFTILVKNVKLSQLWLYPICGTESLPTEAGVGADADIYNKWQ